MGRTDLPDQTCWFGSTWYILIKPLLGAKADCGEKFKRLVTYFSMETKEGKASLG